MVQIVKKLRKKRGSYNRKQSGMFYDVFVELPFVEMSTCILREFITCCMCPVGDERWTSLTTDKQRCHIMHLIDMTEVSDRETRMKAVRALLYLCQGQYHRH